MKPPKALNETPRLEIYPRHSLLFLDHAPPQKFDEGKPSQAAKQRLKQIKESLQQGFLAEQVAYCKSVESALSPLETSHTDLLNSLVSSITSEVGRALVGLTVLQLCIKSIAPEQSIRLHKASPSEGNFSWSEGIPMRTLDTQFITPALREHELLKLNADGFMMTRSLAENYPYSQLYKAAIRGAKLSWLTLVDHIEGGLLSPLPALHYLLRMLLHRSERFHQAANAAMETLRVAASPNQTPTDVARILLRFIDKAPYSARLLEVAMHSLFQVLEDRLMFDGRLKPLSQMRSANKKHGNIGDVEILLCSSGEGILEAWDAKYGLLDLRDELEELHDKLRHHPETEVAGFVTAVDPRVKEDTQKRREELEEIHQTRIEILSFDSWVAKQLERFEEFPSDDLGRQWLLTFGECLCQKRRERAPIDEPCDAWVDALQAFFQAETETP